MKKIVLCLFIVGMVSVGGCSQYGESIDEAQNVEDYSIYSGEWSSDGYSKEDIYKVEGGGILNISVEGNYVEGNYIYVQSESYRIAEVDNISAYIDHSVCEFSFQDDGWGNEGKIKITFGEKIIVEIDALITNPDNSTGMSITGAVLMRENDVKESEGNNNEIDSMEQRIADTEIYRKQSTYWNVVMDWDEENGRTGMDRPIEPLLLSDEKEYTLEELKNYPDTILYLAKNEIYAKHGYIFKDENLQNYFLGQIWYEPEISSEEFDDQVFNKYEKNNLKLLLELLEK